MPRTPKPSTKPPNISDLDREQRQYAAGATHSFENETIQARRIWLAAAPGEYGFENEPIDDHQFGILIQGNKAILVGVETGGVSINALGHTTPFTSSTINVNYFIKPQQDAPGVDGPQYWLGTSTERWTEGYFNHLSVGGSYTGDAGLVQFIDAGTDPSIDGAVQRNGTKLLFNDGSGVADLTLFDHLSKTQGNIIYADGSTWTVLGPGTSGQFLKTNGAAANPSWATVSAAPTNVDYLVGTASSDLSAEIVVGTSPGGELGGSWASPTVDDLHAGSYHPIGKIKTNAENVNNSTTLQNDDELTITVVSGVRYQLDAFIRWSDGGTGGIKWDFTGTSAISYQWTDVDTASTTSTDYLTATATVTVATTGNAHGVRITGAITTSGTTFTFRWACNAGGDTTTVEANSWIRLTRVA